MTFLRYGLPGLICAVGLIWGVARNMDTTGLEIFILLLAAGSSLFLMNALMRIGISGDKDRDAEDAARAYFDEHGVWPEDEGGAAKRD